MFSIKKLYSSTEYSKVYLFYGFDLSEEIPIFDDINQYENNRYSPVLDDEDGNQQDDINKNHELPFIFTFHGSMFDKIR